MKRYLLDDRDIQPIITSALSQGDARFVNVSGDTMTGQLKVPSVSANYLQVSTGATVTPSAGTLSWNALDKTVDVGLEGSVLQLGQEEILYATNLTGSPITNGQIVKVTGSSGNRVVISLGQATPGAQSISVFAIATQTIANNGSGYFTRFGIVRDINTGSWLEGDLLWLSTSAGTLTNVQPDKNYTQLPVAIVTRAHATVGTIMVAPTLVPRLKTLGDVENYTSATEGNYLAFNNGLWRPRGNFYNFEDVVQKFYDKEGKWDSTTTTVSANSASWATTTHDSTLSGNGTVSSPLGVVGVFDTYKVMIDADDESGPGYLSEKLVAGDGVLLNRKVDEHGTRIEIKSDTVYPPIEWLESKLTAGPGITISADANTVTIGTSATSAVNPIIVEYSNQDEIALPYTDSGSALNVWAGDNYFPMDEQNIDNFDCFDNTNGIFSPNKEGYFLFSFSGLLKITSGYTFAKKTSISIRVIQGYNNNNFNNGGVGGEVKFFEMYEDGQTIPVTFNTIVDMRKFGFGSYLPQAVLVITWNANGVDYSNHMSISFSQLHIHEITQSTVISGGGGGGTEDTYKVKTTSADSNPNYLSSKIVAAGGSPITVTVVDDTLVLDAIQDDISDPLIRTIGLMNENGLFGFGGNCYSNVWEDGEWDTGLQQNTTDAFYRVSVEGRGTITKVKFFINSFNDVDYGVSASGNFGACRIGLFTLDGTCKGQTAWVRGLSALGTTTLDMTPCGGQNLTIERNTEYWIGIVARGMQLISYNKADSGFDPGNNALRYALSIRATSMGASWSPNFWNTSGGGFIQNKVPVILMSSTE